MAVNLVDYLLIIIFATKCYGAGIPLSVFCLINTVSSHNSHLFVRPNGVTIWVNVTIRNVTIMSGTETV